MRRGWLWIGAVVTAGAAMVFAARIPEARLARELAAARAEGLPTTGADVRRRIPLATAAENAAGLVRAASEADRRDGKASGKALDGIRDVSRGAASAAQREAVRSLFLAHPEYLARWRAASARPRLVYDRAWEEGWSLLLPEYASVKTGALRLVAAARLGIEPRANLLAAARLSNLTRQEPTVIAGLVAVAIGRSALREAKREGVAREVEAALGPPIDARWAYLPELPASMDLMREIATPDGAHGLLGNGYNQNLWERVRHSGTWRSNATLRILRDYRAFWQAMPKDGTDYAAARAALVRWMPVLDADLSNVSSAVGTMASGDPGQAVDAFAKYEKEREGVRKSGR